MSQKTGKQAIDVTIRRAAALELRKQGLTYRMIVRAMIKQFGVDGLIKNYDERKAYKDVHAAIKKLQQEELELASDVRTLELERLDVLFNAMYTKAIKSKDEKAVNSCLRIMDRRAKMLGLDEPTKHEISNVDPAQIAELLARKPESVLMAYAANTITLQDALDSDDEEEE